MRENRLKKRYLLALLVASAALGLTGPLCRADDRSDLPAAPAPAAAEGNCPESLALPPGCRQTAPPRAARPAAAVPVEHRASHRFQDRENLALFSLVGAARALDYSSTLNMRRRGRQEVFLTNDIVDNHPAFAAIEAGGTAVSIAASYFFHRYRHHRLERWTSIVHAGLATGGAIRNYCLTSEPSSTTP
jgi:hypothetical protein